MKKVDRIGEKFGIEVDGEVPDCQPKEVPAEVYDRYRAMMKQRRTYPTRKELKQ